jgi:hypothetical protein
VKDAIEKPADQTLDGIPAVSLEAVSKLWIAIKGKASMRI